MKKCAPSQRWTPDYGGEATVGKFGLPKTHSRVPLTTSAGSNIVKGNPGDLWRQQSKEAAVVKGTLLAPRKAVEKTGRPHSLGLPSWRSRAEEATVEDLGSQRCAAARHS